MSEDERGNRVSMSTLTQTQNTAPHPMNPARTALEQPDQHVKHARRGQRREPADTAAGPTAVGPPAPGPLPPTPPLPEPDPIPVPPDPVPDPLPPTPTEPDPVPPRPDPLPPPSPIPNPVTIRDGGPTTAFPRI